MAIAQQSNEPWADLKPYGKGMPKDAKAELTEAVGSLDGLLVMGTQLLVAVYIRPEVTAGGIIRPENKGARVEDGFQGTLGLVLKMGVSAFTDDASHRWEGEVPKVGDWVMFNVGDTMGLSIRGCRCRTMEDVVVRMVVPDPGWITDWIVKRQGYA